jgi:hypothetical protein
MNEQRHSHRAVHCVRLPWCGVIAIAALAFAIVVGQAPARAASEVQGDPADMRLLVENASTEEALQALAGSFGLVYSLPANSGRTMTGVYSGTLRQVLARILDRTDYILKISDGTVEVVVLGASGGSAVVSASQPIATKNIVPAGNIVPAALSSKGPPPLASYLAGSSAGRTP